jgi:hypothetical protein
MSEGGSALQTTVSAELEISGCRAVAAAAEYACIMLPDVRAAKAITIRVNVDLPLVVFRFDAPGFLNCWQLSPAKAY